tara:strand:+ start:20929 stop:23646 length:2718 start_codon:yes stop_codon:yes gene_type:complete
MNIAQIEENTKRLIERVEKKEVSQKDFPFELLLSYGHRPQSVGRLRSGERNLAKQEGEVVWKRHIYFKHSKTGSLHSDIDSMRREKFVSKYKIRFVIATDFNEFLAVDTKTLEPLDVDFNDLAKHFDFFLPWAQMEKAVYQGENPADVKAAEKMAKLFDLIKEENFDNDTKNDLQKLHNLNVFLTRLLFCFFAEDTGIFKDNQFSNAIGSHTLADGSDLPDYLDRLFIVLNTPETARKDLPDYLAQFPYVNGGLFSDDIPSPSFSARSRRILIECGSDLDWSNINPDIFGSMIQAVVHTDQRGSMGMHYTSVPNIMKVIEPLFLNSLYDELEEVQENPRRLEKLLQRLANLKIFDPACGSGNFLIIAYKELRRLEMEVFKWLQELELERIDSSKGEMAQLRVPMSGIKLSQFYGIELDDFAHEVAILSLWLAEHQMNQEFKAEFGECPPSLPLTRSGNIVSGNAIRLDWSAICPSQGEVYILGNPPYKGSRVQNEQQKKDMSECFKGIKAYKDIDYVGCWFYKAANYINDESEYAFVSTSSICEGSQVVALWPYIFALNNEISFAIKSFHWSNNAKNKAGVTCSIIGLRKVKRKPKYLYLNDIRHQADNINAYLIAGKTIFVKSSRKPFWNIPVMSAGNYTGHAQPLMLTDEEKKQLLENHPQANIFIKKVVGSNELIKNISRWCIWIPDDQLEFAKSISPISERIEQVRKSRLESKDKEANKIAYRAHQFRDTKVALEHTIVVPTVSSERRKYIPVAFINSDTVITNKAMGIYDGDSYIFSILVSNIHMVWVRAIAGRMRKDISYSSVLCYNTFPMPATTESQKRKLRELAFAVLEARENYPDRSLSSIYDPDKMPENIIDAHKEVDKYVDTLYKNGGFNSDEERLEHLFRMYEKKFNKECGNA